jgi:hypothetical protein
MTGMNTMDQTKYQDTTVENQKCLMVLGMHRSGVSLLAGCLYRLGVNFGSSLMTDDGADGGDAFENQDILLTHEILFRDLGCRWDMVGSLPDGWVESEAAERAAGKIGQIIEDQFLGKGLWAVKDPRLCRVMPLWSKVLGGLDVDPCFIHIIRHPYEVASSLKAHQSMGLFKGHLLWLTYNRDALHVSHKHPHTLLTYDQLLADPISSLLRISESLRIDLPNSPLQYVTLLTEFARSDLKEHHVNDGDVSSSNQAFAPYTWIYEQFRLNQVTALEAPNEYRDMAEKEAFSDLPLVAAVDSAPQARIARSHAVEIFNNLLGEIGRYEQAELDQELLRQRRLLAAAHDTETLYAQLYYPGSGKEDDQYSEENSHKMLLAPNEWQSVTWDVPQPDHMQTRQLRLDPLNTRGMVSISSIKLIHAVTGEVLWVAQDQDQFDQCSIEGEGFVLSEEKGLVLVCTGRNVSLRLPVLPDLPDSPMQLKVWIKATRDQATLNDAWNQLNRETETLIQKEKESQTLLEKAQEEAKNLELQLSQKVEALQAKEKEAQAQLEKAQKQAKDLERQLSQKAEALQTKEKETRAQLEEAHEQAKDLEWQLSQKAEALQTKEKEARAQLKEAQEQTKNLQRQLSQKAEALQTKEKEARIQLEKTQEQTKNLQRQLSQKAEALQTKEKETRAQLKEAQKQVKKLKTEVGDKDHTVATLEKQLAFQEDLSQQYFRALEVSESESLARIDDLEKQIHHKQEALEEIETRLESEKIRVSEYLSSLMTAREEDKNNRRLNEENKRLITWMLELKHAYQVMAGNWKWKLAYAASRSFEMFRFHHNNPSAIKQIQVVLMTFEKKRQSAMRIVARDGLQHQHHSDVLTAEQLREDNRRLKSENEQLTAWLLELKYAYEFLAATWKFKLANAASRSLEKLRIGKKNISVKRKIEQIFNQFEKTQQLTDGVL